MRESIPRSFVVVVVALALVTTVAAEPSGPITQDTGANQFLDLAALLDKLDSPRGICAIVGHRDGRLAFELAGASELVIHLELPDAVAVRAVRRQADDAGLLNSRVFVDQATGRIPLADNLVDVVLWSPRPTRTEVTREEVLRVLRPGGKALMGRTWEEKPAAEGVDDWSHPYHGPDNNTQSTDQLARAPYRTQFLAEPKFCPMPEVSVASGGRVYRAFGHIAHKANQNSMLNTLLCYNAHNGTILWRRPLREGFMIHRNTMIATPEAFYLADDVSCKILDPATGEPLDEIVVPEGISDGPVWKWMARQDGRLHALVGGEEVKPTTRPSNTPGLGHWPWGMWQGHEYANPETNFGFGRTFAAFDPATKRLLWSHREEEPIDSRGVCMSGSRIYYCCPGKFVGCLDAKTGEVLWKTSDAALIEAIGPDGRAQHYVTGYATSSYIKCHDEYLFFAGSQRTRLVVASTVDGRLLWQREGGNLQLVLRDDAIYAAGPAQTGVKLAYETGKQLSTLPTRRACTRATGSVDSVFYRASGGTIRIDTATNRASHIAPMRPPCQDGVMISDGQLYWGPWMCGCQLSLYGHICLAPAGTLAESNGEDDRLRPGMGDMTSVETFESQPGDWPVRGGNNARTCATDVRPPRDVQQQWAYRIPSAIMPTAPVVAAGVTFFGDRNGTLRAVDSDGKLIWRAHVGGAIYFPPAVAKGRVFVGSADGRVHAFEATTGRALWSYRVGPVDRRISVFGRLVSTWPVAGGVVVEGDTVHAAAGIAHYDGTHVVALDIATGMPKWRNDSSGVVSKQVDSGISLQGELYLADGELRFLGGGVHETARYDLRTGTCLNQPVHGLNSTFHTAFYSHYPAYGKYVSLDHTLSDGRSLVHDVSYEGSQLSSLALFEPLPAGVRKPFKPKSRWGRRNPQAVGPKTVWQNQSGRRYTAFVVTPDLLLATSHTGQPAHPDAPSLLAIEIEDGSTVWQRELPSVAVKGGIALDAEGRIVVALEDGRVVCFAKR